jgi:hypothetical protein
MKWNLAFLLCALFSTNALGQPAKKTNIKVGTIEAAEKCTFYQGIRYNSKTTASGSSSGYVAGSGSGYANGYGAGGSSSYAAGGRSSYAASNTTSLETYFVKDCVKDFEGIRTAIQASLASTGTIIVAPGGYTISGRIEDVVPTASGFAEQTIDGQGYGTMSEGLKVTMSIIIADNAGRIIFGEPITAEIETGSVSKVRGTVGANVSSGEGLYSLLQRQVALVAAKKVAFHFNPLLVSQGNGKNIQLNYGSPLLEVGNMVSVTSIDGSSAATYRITSVSQGSSLARQIGDAETSAILAGSRASVIERGDPAANQSRLQKVELP